MGFPLVLLAGGAAYLLLRNQQAAAAPASASVNPLDATGTGGIAIGSPVYAPIGQQSDPRTWYNGIEPGTVQVGGQPTNSNPNGGLATDNEIQFGVQTAASVLQKIPFPPAQIAGAVMQTISSIVGMFTAHHQGALAAEGKALNSSDNTMVNMMVLVLQGVLTGEVTTIAQAQTMVNTTESDWYAAVKSVQHGMWHYTGQDLTADYQKVWIQHFQPPAGAPGYSDYHMPNGCNGAALIGHFFTERNGFLVMAAVKDALAGNHGILTLPDIPSHDTQSGLPEVTVVY